MNSDKKNIRKKLIHHYRWLIVDDDSQKAKFSFRINILNFLLFLSFLSLIIFLLSYLFLKYSPVKDYFVDNSSSSVTRSAQKKELLELNEKIIALEDSLSTNQLYLSAISKVITGNVAPEQVDSLVAKQSPVILDDKALLPTPEDSIFRMNMAKEELENLKANNTSNSQMLFPPVRGIITSSYDITQEHLATDIAAIKGEDIKAIADGKVIYTDWSPNTGNVIILQHKNEIISIYKHCSQIYKTIGSDVEKGDLIAAVGNGGELTTGPHLHFELWIQGNAVNAQDYIDF